MSKINVGISIGDVNGIGIETIIKTFKRQSHDGFFALLSFLAHKKQLQYIEKQLKLQILVLILLIKLKMQILKEQIF